MRYYDWSAKRFPRYRDFSKNYSSYLKIELTEDQEAELQALIDQLTARLNGDCTTEEGEELDAVLQRASMVQMAYCGLPLSAIVEEVRRPKQTVSRILKNFRENGFVALYRKPGRPPQPEVSNEIVHQLQTLKENADLQTPAEYLQAFNAWADAPVSLATVRRYLRKAGIRFRRPKKTKILLVITNS